MPPMPRPAGPPPRHAPRSSVVSAEIWAERTQAHALRIPLLNEWERLTGRTPLTYFANFGIEQGQISDEDVDLIEDLLNAMPHGTKLDLIIESPGGYPLSAERLVKACRTFSSDFRVVVPRRAKSAATMVAMGARGILMGPAAELGPIDPQIWYIDRSGEARYASVYVIIKGVQDVLNECKAFPKDARIEGLLMMMPPFDRAMVLELERAQNLAEDLAVQWYRQVPRNQRKTRAQIKNALKVFLNPQQTYSHGRPIDYKVAKSAGLAVTQLDRQSREWDVLHKISVRSAESAGRFAKAIETINESFARVPVS
jgi:Serine dehydrogenase proteinase